MQNLAAESGTLMQVRVCAQRKAEASPEALPWWYSNGLRQVIRSEISLGWGRLSARRFACAT